MSGSATETPSVSHGPDVATPQTNLRGMSRIEPVGGAGGQHSRRKLEVGTALPVAEEGALRSKELQASPGMGSF